jgi:predicted PhzF superfamily epimerase YddE/YHI9
MPRLHVLEVFISPEGEGGNRLGVFLEGNEIPEAERQRIAHELGFSETVFVDDAARGAIRIFTPASELPFAGHPCVGTAWLLRREREPVYALRPPPGEVPVRYEDGDVVWIAARREWCPPFEFFQLNSADEVDALTEPPQGSGLAYCWAWEDEDTGHVRARGLFPDEGITEDEATGSAAIALSADLDRPLAIRQGRGSRLATKLRDDGYVEVGGLTRLVGERMY